MTASLVTVRVGASVTHFNDPALVERWVVHLMAISLQQQSVPKAEPLVAPRSSRKRVQQQSTPNVELDSLSPASSGTTQRPARHNERDLVTDILAMTASGASPGAVGKQLQAEAKRFYTLTPEKPHGVGSAQDGAQRSIARHSDKQGNAEEMMINVMPDSIDNRRLENIHVMPRSIDNQRLTNPVHDVSDEPVHD